MRRWLTFAAPGGECAACLDQGCGPVGVVMVSGGTELACGANGGMARVAASLARRGASVLRFDRPGVGDSMGNDTGFERSGAAIAAAVRTLRAACDRIERVVLVGNCDAASALLLAQGELKVDTAVHGFVLTNVWLDHSGAGDALPPPAAIRRRYLARLASPREWWRLVSGGVNLRKLAAGLLAASHAPSPTDLAGRLAAAAERVSAPVVVLLADGDATAIGFADARSREPLRSAIRKFDVRAYTSRSHSFADAADRRLLIEAIVEAGG